MWEKKVYVYIMYVCVYVYEYYGICTHSEGGDCASVR